ncbi:MAG: hypothetical protein IIY04_00405 [Oscillospiraceae bacterium]|nr:hypothetical protein [Oscillospiraceae bacterium]
MKRTIDHAQFREAFLKAVSSEIDRHIFAEDGSICNKGIYRNMLSAEAACSMAERFGLAYKLTGEKKYEDAGKHTLDYIGRSLIRNGYVYWPMPLVTMCRQGRWAMCALQAAENLNDKNALAWLEEIFVNWPYDWEKHRFVERFVPMTQYPSSINGCLTIVNMLAEGVVDSWLVATHTGNQELIEKAKDTLVNTILPAQMESGMFPYHIKRDVDMGILNDGEDEYNYALYLVYLLSELFKIDEAREILLEPMKKAFDYLVGEFGFSDGSMYAPVHWGWDHHLESTIFMSVIAWRFYRFCGLSEYESVCARALHWLMVVDFGAGMYNNGMSVCGLYWNPALMRMMAEGLNVTGDVAEKSEIIANLEHTVEQLRYPPADRIHHRHFFHEANGAAVFETRNALQRRVQRLKRDGDDAAQIPQAPASVRLDMPWSYPEDGYTAEATLSYDADALYLTVQTDCKKFTQPYEAQSMFAGDGVLLELNTVGVHCLLTLTQENGKNVIYRYNDATPTSGGDQWANLQLCPGDYSKATVPFGGDVRLYLAEVPRGWYLEKSTLSCEMKEEGMCFTAKLLWSELGFAPKKGDRWTGGISVNRLTLYGPQYNQWGNTAMEMNDRSFDGTFEFA